MNEVEVELELDKAASELESALTELNTTGDVAVVRKVLKSADSILAGIQKYERGF